MIRTPDHRPTVFAVWAGAFAAVVLAGLTTVSPVAAKDVKMVLQVEPELHLTGTEKVYLGPIMVEPRAEAEASGIDRIASREFESYVRRLLRRETRLNLLDPVPGLQLPTENPLKLLDMKDFWLQLGRETGADYIVTASIDVDVLDRSGYQMEEYVSPTDGKTYYRQVLVEDTGFKYDILVTVFKGATAEVVHSEQISDFQQKSEKKLEAFTDMFNDLYTLENRLLGIFVPRHIRAKRYLFN